jgi:hypothetical protein
MISGNAPDRNAMTGVPQARASIATKELVSETVLGIIKHFAWDRRRLFFKNPTGPTNLLIVSRRGRMVRLK